MPSYYFEAMDQTGQEIKDVVEATNQEEAQATIKQMGYFVTKISVKKSRKTAAQQKGSGKGKSFALGGVSSKVLTTFTRQLSILQDAGLPILRSLKILEQQSTGGALKNALIDVCDEIEGGATLSEAMAKVPKAFNRLYVNMIKAGGTTLYALATATGGQLTVAAQDLSLGSAAGPLSALLTTSSIGTTAMASAMITTLGTAITATNASLGQLGTGATALQNQLTFIQNLQDTLDTGVGNLVNANLGKESAQLTALQTKQQLGIQALSIANQSSSVLLSLFR